MSKYNLDEEFRKILESEEVFDDENTDDLDEIEDAEEEDGVEVKEPGDEGYDEPIVLDPGEVVDDIANSDIMEGSLFDGDDDEDDESPVSVPLRVKFLDKQIAVPVTLGVSGNSASIVGNSSVGSAGGGVSAPSGGGAVSESIVELKRFDPDPNVVTVLPNDLNFNTSNSFSIDGDYAIKTPETNNIQKLTNKLLVSEEAIPFISTTEGFDLVLAKSNKGKIERVDESLLYAFSLSNESEDNIFATNSRFVNEEVYKLLESKGKISKGKQLCEDCGTEMSMNESGEMICENCMSVNEQKEPELEKDMIVCNECGHEELVDKGINEDEAICENCGSKSLEVKRGIKESVTPYDVIKELKEISEEKGLVELIIHNEAYLTNKPNTLKFTNLTGIEDVSPSGKSFRKVTISKPNTNEVIKTFVTDIPVNIKDLVKSFDGFNLNKVIAESITEIEGSNINLEETTNEIINATNDEALFEGLEDSLDEFYDEEVFEAYENVKDSSRVKKFLEENLTDLDTNKTLIVEDNLVSISGTNKSLAIEESQEVIDSLTESHRLEKDLLLENHFTILNN